MNSVTVILLIITVSATLSSWGFTQSSSSSSKVSPSYGPGQHCNSTHICVDRNGTSESSSIYCTNKSICECTKDSHPGSGEDEGSCLVNAGGSCSAFTKCEKSADCSSDGICTCKEVSSFGDGLCHVHLYDQSCNTGNHVDPTTLKNLRLQRLICLSRRYICKNPMSHKYDDNFGSRNYVYNRDYKYQKKCLTRVGAPCNDRDPNMNCNQPRMECRNASKVRGVQQQACFCQPGYSPSNDGFSCSFLSFGSKCDPNHNRWETSSDTIGCNHEEGLVCSENGLCKCSDDFVFFEEETNRCVSPIGYYCDERRYFRCERGSDCIPVIGGNFDVNANGICQPKCV
jgi:hypothetical protein